LRLLHKGEMVKKVALDSGLRTLTVGSTRYVEMPPTTSIVIPDDVDPQLFKTAHRLAAAGIRNTATWKAARTEGEFIGTVGEHLTHLQIEAVMPVHAPGMKQGDELVHLHSVHFTGNLYAAQASATPTRTNTDVCAELDLMTVVRHESGSMQCIAVGNTKVSRTSLAPEAEQQNADAVAALRAFVANERAPLPSSAPSSSSSPSSASSSSSPSSNSNSNFATWIEVQFVEAARVAGGDKLTFDRSTLTLAPVIDQRTIGARSAGGAYTQHITESFAEARVISMILRTGQERD
jgi:hypothetical protein